MRSPEAVPAAGWLRTYRRAWLRAEVVGGITAGLVVVPQAMAYATIADLPVQVGLDTCMVPMAVYALLGGSRILSVSWTVISIKDDWSTVFPEHPRSAAASPCREPRAMRVPRSRTSRCRRPIAGRVRTTSASVAELPGGRGNHATAGAAA